MVFGVTIADQRYFCRILPRYVRVHVDQICCKPAIVSGRSACGSYLLMAAACKLSFTTICESTGQVIFSFCWQRCVACQGDFRCAVNSGFGLYLLCDVLATMCRALHYIGNVLWSVVASSTMLAVVCGMFYGTLQYATLCSMETFNMCL